MTTLRTPKKTDFKIGLRLLTKQGRIFVLTAKKSTGIWLSNNRMFFEKEAISYKMLN